MRDYTDEEYWAVVAERNKHANRADAAEAKLREIRESLDKEGLGVSGAVLAVLTLAGIRAILDHEGGE